MKIKDTLNMPKTDFPMKASLPQNEPKMREKWYEEDVYNQVLEKNKDKKPFYLHDGPPYANGNIHCGHALNKILKDIIIRFKNMNGFYAPIVFGWDTHGLPIENAMLKEIRKGTDELDTIFLRKECAKYAKQQVANQKEQFFQLGLLADKNVDYLTLYHYFEAAQIEVFNAMVKNNLIYQKLKPVYWSWSSKTALAEAEIEYHDIKSPAIYVKFPLKEHKDINLVIWTTTPWTLPANQGIAIGKDIEYSLINTNAGKLIIAKNLVSDFIEKTGLDLNNTIETFKGKDLENLEIEHPLNQKTFKIMLGDHVTDTAGTGCVHTAPGHGEDDYIVGLNYDLDILSIVDENGMLTEDAGEFANIFYDDANKIITEKLKENGALIKLDFITHSYPHDWRSKKPIFYRATKQWFCDVTKIKNELLENIEKTDFLNPWAKKRLSKMIENRDAWCISRQRKWGVPIPIFYAENGEPILDPNVIMHVAELFREHGSDIWYEWDVKDLLPKDYVNELSPNNIFTKEEDIMDVWFDSGSSHHAVLRHFYDIDQADLYLEGSDQYRGWFNSSLITSVALNKKAPYKMLASHGFVLDAKGNKMSKSLGNIVDPLKIIETRGSDILRLWAASVDFQQDVNISDDVLTQISEIYRKYRNTIRFLLGNLNDFDKEKIISFEELEDVDKYVMVKLKHLSKKVINLYQNYNFNQIVSEINNYITKLLSGFYLDFIKDIIYVSKANDKRRRQIQTVLYYNLNQLIDLMTPIIPHTTYEANTYNNDDCIFMHQMNDLSDLNILNDELLTKTFDQFLLIREDINKALDAARKNKQMGSSLKSNVIIKPANDEIKKIIESIDAINTLCIVHNLIIDDNDGEEYKAGKIEVQAVNLPECQRCRKLFNEQELNTLTIEDNETLLCGECFEIVKNWKEDV